MLAKAESIAEQTCQHCRTPLGTHPVSEPSLDGGPSTWYCCTGCAMVSRLIRNSGLDQFYKLQNSPGRPAEMLEPEEARRLRLYDDPELQHRLSRPDGPHHRKIVLDLTGVTCAACVWLLERQLRSLVGVRDAWVGLASHRAEVVWNPGELKLGEILSSIRRLGYGVRAEPDRENALAAEQQRLQATRDSLFGLGLAGIGAMQNMMLSIPIYLGLLEASGEHFLHLFRLGGLILTTPVLFISARPFLLGGWRGLRSGQPGMDLPVAIALLAAYLASLASLLTGGAEVYFDSICMFTFFLLVARFLEQRAREHAVADLSAHRARSGAPVCRVAETGDPHKPPEQQIVFPDELEPGDQLVLERDEMLPTDSLLLDAFATFDEATVTGEFDPKTRTAGQMILAGSILKSSAARFQVLAIPAESNLHRIEALAEQGLRSRDHMLSGIDRAARWFVPVILGIASLAAFTWLWLDPSRAFEVTLALLVATCPCALSLAAPAALTHATHALRRAGFIVAQPHVLESMAALKQLVFDKTGTLTCGQFELLHTEVSEDYALDEVLQIAAALEKEAVHPIARLFQRLARDLPRSAGEELSASTTTERSGYGVCGTIDGKAWRLGNLALVEGWTQNTVDQRMRIHASALRRTGTADRIDEAASEIQQTTPVYLANETGLVACFYLDDTLRPGARETIQHLSRKGLDIRVLSGDRRERCADLARTLGLPARNVVGELKPEDKLASLRKLEDRGVTAVVGDGLNDLPVMAAADVSIALSEAAALTQTRADSILLAHRIALLPAVIEHARRTRRVIRQNIRWAIFYNLSVVPFAALGLVAPWVAALGMSLSSILVVLNSSRLGKIRQEAQYLPEEALPEAPLPSGPRLSGLT